MWGRTLQFLPKSKDREGLLPWVIGVMLYLCALAIAAASAVGNGVDDWSRSLSSNMTVQVIVADADERARQTEAALRLLRATPGIESAEVLASSEVMELVSPWLGEIPIEAGLPIPDLIEVKVTDGADINSVGLAERLVQTAPGATLDTHQDWLEQIIDLAAVLQAVMATVVVMVVLSTVAIVIFGCRAGLATHAESIEIMHLIGAEDKTISNAFDVKYMIHGLKGGLVGVVFAALTLWLINNMAAELSEGLVSAAVPSATNAFWLLLLPVMAAILTMATARITVRKALSAMM